MKEKIIVALDVPTAEAAMAIVSALGNAVGAYKVGMQLYNATGPAILAAIAEKGGQVFLDLKFHDIPNTVAEAVRVAAHLGVLMCNVHASGGYEMMAKAAAAIREEAAESGGERPLLLGVTVLTSMGQDELREELGVERPLQEQVSHLAKLAKRAGLDGVVASAREIPAIRAACGDDFLIVTPGIRPKNAAVHDQKRVMTPGEAVRAGADYLVIGRPIAKAANPLQAVKEIVAEIEEAMKE